MSATTRDAEDVQQRDHDQRDERDPLLVGAGCPGRMSLSPMSLMTGISVSGSVAHDRGDGQRARPQVDPAREPRVRLGLAEELRPLEDRARDREVARDLGEVQRDDELAERDDRERPDERAAERADAEDEQREDAGRRRDVAERRGERAEEVQPAVQRLLVAEAARGRRLSSCVERDWSVAAMAATLVRLWQSMSRLAFAAEGAAVDTFARHGGVPRAWTSCAPRSATATVDTVLLALTDMQGRLQGKRLTARALPRRRSSSTAPRPATTCSPSTSR